MKTLAQKFLTPEEQEKITRAVQAAEKRTSGEIVPLIASASHSYPLAPITGATFIALPTALLATRLTGHMLWLGPDNMWLFIVFFAAFFAGAHQCINFAPPLKRLFLSSRRSDVEVQEAATKTFFTEKLYQTKARNGILLYISVFEHRVWILADSGINEKISPDKWLEIVTMVTNGIKNGQACDAMCDAISNIGEILEKFFPIEDDDKDELHNLIIL